MRFVSQYTKFGVGIRPERRRMSMDGEQIVTTEGLFAQFEEHRFNQRDLEVALASFQFRGQYQHEDEATPVDPSYRLSTYDTDIEAERHGWDTATKELVEQKLLTVGSFGNAFTIVPELEIQPPWPKYLDWDGDDVDDLVILAHDTIGVPFEDVIRFEESKWGPRRQDVLEAFTDAIRIRDEGKVVVG